MRLVSGTLKVNSVTFQSSLDTYFILFQNFCANNLFYFKQFIGFSGKIKKSDIFRSLSVTWAIEKTRSNLFYVKLSDNRTL